MKLFKETLLILTVLLFVCSCKNETNKTEKKLEQQPKTETSKTKKTKVCNITVKGVFPANDVIELFFAEIATDKFAGKNKVRRRITGREKSQKIVFNLFDYYPEKIRLDLGANKKMEKVILEEITINYDENIFKIDNTNIDKYFTKNAYISYGVDNNISLVELEKEGVKTYDPFLISSPLLVKELVKL